MLKKPRPKHSERTWTIRVGRTDDPGCDPHVLETRLGSRSTLKTFASQENARQYKRDAPGTLTKDWTLVRVEITEL